MTVITNLLLLGAGLIALVVVLTSLFLWYETANREPELLNGRLAPAKLWLAARLMLGEFLALCLIVLTHPLGWSNPPDQSSGNKTGTPVIFLHGLFHNRAAWIWYKFLLRRKGLTDLYCLNLPVWKDVETLTERVAKLVDELRHQRGIEKVHLVGHSLGGVIARNYIQIRGGATKVDRCVLIGTPNAGSKLVPFVVTELGKILLPGSPFLTNLNAQPFPDSVKVTNIYSRHDTMVIPYDLARLDGQENIELRVIGHAALLFHAKVFRAMHKALTESHADA